VAFPSPCATIRTQVKIQRHGSEVEKKKPARVFGDYSVTVPRQSEMPPGVELIEML
jgi:hypothetical protein